MAIKILHLKMYKGNWHNFEIKVREGRDIKDHRVVRGMIRRLTRYKENSYVHQSAV